MAADTTTGARRWRSTPYLAASALSALAVVLWMASPEFGDASSHREAPLISNDPLADNTDLYAFRSPDNPGTVTIIATARRRAELPHVRREHPL
jgi:hypothetical protein